MSARRAKILVVGLSARALSASARAAGYGPLAADLFGDLDLQESAEASIRVEGDLETGLEASPLLGALDTLVAERSPIGIVCGTGFEDRPGILDQLGQRWPLFGNDGEAVARVKDPGSLADICRRLGIRHPEWSATPKAGPDWLRKRRGGAGGAHVKAGDEAGDDVYWQERVGGDAVSALLLGGGGRALLLGFSAQWPDPSPDVPFRYGGALRPAPLPANTAAALEDPAEAIVEACGLVGLNSVDFLVDEAEWHLVEVNPRPGATLDIFESPDGDLFRLHMDACRGQLPAQRPTFAGAAAAATVYARRSVRSVPEFAWPSWTADRQPPGTSIAIGAPVCTVLAEADDPAEARRLVGERGALIQAALGAD